MWISKEDIGTAFWPAMGAIIAGGAIALILLRNTGNLIVDEYTIFLFVIAILPYIARFIKKLKIGEFELELKTFGDVTNEAIKEIENLKNKQKTGVKTPNISDKDLISKSQELTSNWRYKLVNHIVDIEMIVHKTYEANPSNNNYKQFPEKIHHLATEEIFSPKLNVELVRTITQFDIISQVKDMEEEIGNSFVAVGNKLIEKLMEMVNTQH